MPVEARRVEQYEDPQTRERGAMNRLVARVPLGVVLALSVLAAFGAGFHDGR